MTTAPEPPWHAAAPAIFELVDAIDRRARRSIDPGILGPVQDAIGAILGPDGWAAGGPLPARAGAPVDATVVRACVAFAEQFVVDVAGTTDAQRAAMTEAMGADAFTFVQVVYVSDVLRRARIGLGRLFAIDPPARTADAAVPGDQLGAADDGADLWSMLEAFMAQVARRDALDPLTAELIRLRGARVHDCRLCRSRLSVRALDAAGDPAIFDELDRFEAGGLTERQKVALRLTDALVTQPSSIDADLRASVQQQFTTDEIVEIVLDVARNAANKIAVALGADAAVVTDGVEYYDIDADGEVVADVDMDAVRLATAG